MMQTSMLTAEKPDKYGQIHPIETTCRIESALCEFKEHVDKLPSSQTTCLRQAQEACPSLLSDDFQLMFLRCEVYNVALAATRYTYYWEKRVEIFGPTKAFEPLTLSGALRDDAVALSLGVFFLTGTKDPMGRSIIFGDPSKLDLTKCSRESLVRASWYTFHCALHDEQTQKHGVVMMVYPHHVKLHQLDRKLMKLNTECIKGAIPVRLAAIHICHPPTFFAIVWQVLKVFLGKLRKRVKNHSGDREHVLKSLAAYGLDKSVVPTDIGGDVVVDVASWLEAQRAAGT